MHHLKKLAFDNNNYLSIETNNNHNYLSIHPDINFFFSVIRVVQVCSISSVFQTIIQILPNMEIMLLLDANINKYYAGTVV